MDTQLITLSIAADFSKTPGSRYRAESKFSGEEFREEVLKTLFLKAIERGTKLVVNLDGTQGYATSFLEEAFGGLAREFGPEKVLSHLSFISNEEEYLKSEIDGYIRNATV